MRHDLLQDAWRHVRDITLLAARNWVLLVIAYEVIAGCIEWVRVRNKKRAASVRQSML
jgi:hypothetical protein